MASPPLPSHRNDDDQREEQVAQSVAELLPDVLSDVTALFAETSSGMIRQSIDDGGVMMALPLKGMLGRLGSKSWTKAGLNCLVLDVNWPVRQSWPASKVFSMLTSCRPTA